MVSQARRNALTNFNRLKSTLFNNLAWLVRFCRETSRNFQDIQFNLFSRALWVAIVPWNFCFTAFNPLSFLKYRKIAKFHWFRLEKSKVEHPLKITSPSLQWSFSSLWWIGLTWLICLVTYLFLSQGERLYMEAITNMKIPLSTILDLRKQFVPSAKIVKQVEEIQTSLQDFLTKSTGWCTIAPKYCLFS